MTRSSPGPTRSTILCEPGPPVASHILSSHDEKEAVTMQSTHATNSMEVLNRSIDRFLLAAGWRVTAVLRHADGTGYDVTLTKEAEPDRGRSVTRTAPSAGEATLKACSSARLVGIPPS